ncbi:MAG: RNA-binding S4 domain-containing protein [Flavobacteriales bacterium]|nr:RNA-binding S4 domain-containing protein [Flavobacteriales bacterium]
METVRFDLEGEYIELNQLLKLTGLCASGGQGKVIVSEGLVKVDGAVELRRTCKIRSGQRVEYNGNTIVVN